MEGETQWTDDRIRWVEDFQNNIDNAQDETEEDEEEECAYIDPFKDPNPMETFSFQFSISDDNNNANLINIELQGYKRDADAVWKSTGLTLWRASEHLCQYLVKHAEMLQGKRILELGAGLGLVGILAHRLAANSMVCITDGDSDALVHLRKNLEHNQFTTAKDNRTVLARQLIWGRETTEQFLQRDQQQQQQPQTFDVLLASDIIYARVIVEPLWETVQLLLSRTKEAVFIMAYAKRDVPVTIDFVLQYAEECGFTHELVDEDPEGIWVYQFRWKDS